MIAVLTALILLISVGSVSANPYCLYGGGNCVYFTYECIDAYWEVTPDIPRDWDAYRWVELIGQEKDGYIIEQVESPAIGDVFVLPKTEEYPYGHVAMIVGETREIFLIDGTYETCYKVIESNMYPDTQQFKYEHKGCLYRYRNYWQEDFADAVFLRCEAK